MNHLEIFLSWSTLSFEIAVCGFVFARKVQRTLPLFAAYAYVLLTCTIGVWLTYVFSGFDSLTSYRAYWISVVVNGAARSLAIAELCRYGLRAYRGIWALVWRLLATLSALLLAHALIDTWGQPHGIAIYGTTLERDLDLASIVIFAALFLIRKYYGIAFAPLQKWIATGICLLCTVDAIGNTILRNLLKGPLFSWFLESQRALWPALKPQIMRVYDLWSTVHLFSFMFSMGIWCYALRKPVAEASESPMLLPTRVYREVSPAINLRLATLDTMLLELLEP